MRSSSCQIHFDSGDGDVFAAESQPLPIARTVESRSALSAERSAAENRSAITAATITWRILASEDLPARLNTELVVIGTQLKRPAACLGEQTCARYTSPYADTRTYQAALVFAASIPDWTLSLAQSFEWDPAH